MHLRHLHLRNPIPYIHSLRLQESILEKHFAHNTLLRNNASLKAHSADTPQPTLLTFQTLPTYTVGRRHLNNNPLSPAQISFLTGASSTSSKAQDGQITEGDPGSRPGTRDLATFFASPRGGLLTYHAPGQLTAYLILNLRSHSLTPRCYIRLLENTVIRTCARHGVPNVMVTEDPGVWIAEKSTEIANKPSTQADGEACIVGSTNTNHDLRPTDRKICAIGVHVSRGITSHGIGLNVFDSPIQPQQQAMYTLPERSIYTNGNSSTGNNISDDGTTLAPGYLSWGFSRIVACGLEGKSVTWLDRERNMVPNGPAGMENQRSTVRPDEVAQSLAVEVSRSLKLEENTIESITEKDVLGA